MRYAIILLSIVIFTFPSTAQNDLPLFAKMIEIKNSSEFELANYLNKKDLEVETIEKNEQAKAKLNNFNGSLKCLRAYMNVKNESDKLILQLKADLTLSNKLRQLKKLQKGKAEMSWYNTQITAINGKYVELINCINGNKELTAVGLPDITGLFTAIAGIFTGSRDARAERIKSLCSQLDDLRLNEVSDLTKPADKSDKKDKE